MHTKAETIKEKEKEKVKWHIDNEKGKKEKSVCVCVHVEHRDSVAVPSEMSDFSIMIMITVIV